VPSSGSMVWSTTSAMPGIDPMIPVVPRRRLGWMRGRCPGRICSPLQGDDEGRREIRPRRCLRWNPGLFRPFRAVTGVRCDTQGAAREVPGRCPGLSCWAPSGPGTRSTAQQNAAARPWRTLGNRRLFPSVQRRGPGVGTPGHSRSPLRGCWDSSQTNPLRRHVNRHNPLRHHKRRRAVRRLFAPRPIAAAPRPLQMRFHDMPVELTTMGEDTAM
jgi:hypothetical protein